MKSDVPLANTLSHNENKIAEEKDLKQIDFHGVSRELEYLISQYNLSLNQVFKIEEELEPDMTRDERLELIEKRVNEIEFRKGRVHTRKDFDTVRTDGDYGNKPDPVF